MVPLLFEFFCSESLMAAVGFEIRARANVDYVGFPGFFASPIPEIEIIKSYGCWLGSSISRVAMGHLSYNQSTLRIEVHFKGGHRILYSNSIVSPTTAVIYS